MPPVSEKQRRWAFANKDENTREGRAAKEFANADPGGKLPERKASKMYSDKSRKQMER